MATVQHVAFNCRDRRAQEGFYSRHFGFRRVRTFNAGRPDEFVMLRRGGMCLELFQAGDEATETRGGSQPVGFAHLAFEVEDIEAAIVALKADGIGPDDVIDCSGIVEGFRVCFFDDPEGNRVEIMQGYEDEPPQ